MTPAQSMRVALLHLLGVVALALLLSLGSGCNCSAAEFASIAQGIGAIIASAFIVGLAVGLYRKRGRL